jgi:uncharacterized protein
MGDWRHDVLVWQITEADVETLAAGARLLGAGGGGEMGLAILYLRRALRENGPVPVLHPTELLPGQHASAVGACGSVTVHHERPMEGNELIRALREVERRSGVKADAVACWQIGGTPALFAATVAAKLGLPLVDADVAGRGCSNYVRTIFTVTGVDFTPAAFTNDRGSSLVVNGVDTYALDRMIYPVLPALGGWAFMAGRPMSRDELITTLVPGSFTKACELGRLLSSGDREEMAARYGVRTLFHGKVIEVQRRIFRGFPAGTAVIEHADQQDRVLRVEMQAEYLAVMEDGRALACVPDLISVLEHETNMCLMTEQLRYGLWVEVLGMPCVSQWRSDKGLEVFGPRAFGYDFDHVPMGECLA